jgi:signal transduction histidine kinase
VHDVGDLQDPIAEDKYLTLKVEPADEANLQGDYCDLLFEAVADLVNNAVKFTPEDRRASSSPWFAVRPRLALVFRLYFLAIRGDPCAL